MHLFCKNKKIISGTLVSETYAGTIIQPVVKQHKSF